MASVKAMMDCIGIDTGGTVSVLFHLYGFFRARVPTDPEPTATAQVSLLEHMRALQDDFVNLNVIRVGIDNFSEDEIDRIDYAVYKIRNIYETRDLGVGRVEHYDITSTDANGRDDLGSPDEAEELTQEWTVPNDGLDVFVVDNISDPDFVGISPIDGPCDKDAKGWSGAIGGEVNRTWERVARTFAHEIGHYLGLSHNHGDDCPTTAAGRANLMAQTRCADSDRDSVVLTAAQGNNMRDHCAVRDDC
jgi:hypothetical protein